MAKLENLLNCAIKLDGYSEHDAMQSLKRKPWPRKEALGHLADWEMACQGWLARALTEPRLNKRGYPSDDGYLCSSTARCPGRKSSIYGRVNWFLTHVLRHLP
jgi:hypothetical protein